MSSFEEGADTGGKNRSFNFCTNLFTYLFQHVRLTFQNILACFSILLLTWNLICNKCDPRMMARCLHSNQLLAPTHTGSLRLSPEPLYLF